LFLTFPSFAPAGALFGRFNTGHDPNAGIAQGIEDGSFKRQVQGTSDRRRFLGTLFVTFCIGVAASLVLGVCVMLMTGEARGAESGELAPMKTDAVREAASAGETRAKAIEFALTHHLVTKYTSLIAIDRTPAAEMDPKTAAPTRLSEGRGCEAICGTRNLQ